MKNGKLKKLITLATVVASTFALVACGSSSSDDSKGSDSSAKKDSGTVYRTLDEIKKDGTINIGVFSDKNPFGYVDENGEYQGSAISGNIPMTVGSAVVTGIAQATENILEIYKNKNNWVGFVNDMKNDAV